MLDQYDGRAVLVRVALLVADISESLELRRRGHKQIVRNN